MKMKTLFVCAMCVALLSFSIANYPQVKVRDWSQVSMMIVDEVWNNAKSEIVSQIGEAGFDSVKNNYDFKSIPKEMSLFDGKRKKELKELSEKLGKLNKVYKVATFNHNFQGTNFGKYAILMVPYIGNETWDENVKWDTVYFILPENLIEIK